MVKDLLIIIMGILFLYISGYAVLRYYRYIKNGHVLDGEIVEHLSQYRTVRLVIKFKFKNKSMAMPSFQLFTFIRPPIGKKVQIYYADFYHDFIYVAKTKQVFFIIMLILLGITTISLGTAELFGFIG